MSPRFVFFDLDDTLLDHGRAEANALADVHTALAEHVGHHALDDVRAAYRQSNGSDLWADYGAGRITSADLKRLRSERFLAAVGAEHIGADAFSDAYLGRYAAHWAWAEGARDAFLAVAARLPIGILTNGFIEQQRGKLARFPEIARAASVVLISEEAGVAKPHRPAFDGALAAAEQATGLTLASRDVLLVGDSLASDITGAVAAGWQAVWVGGDAARAPAGVSVVATCADLPDPLGFSGGRLA